MDSCLGLAAMTAGLALTACATSSAVFYRPQLEREESYCTPPPGMIFALQSEPPPPEGAAENERIAALVGLRAVLNEHPRSEKSRLLALERMERARLAIDATAAELQCLRDLTEHAAEVLNRTTSGLTQALTISSIAAGAATSIAAVFLATHNASASVQEGVAIGGGAVTAGLAVASPYVPGHVPFHTPRNLLEPIWTGPESTPFYPPVVWMYLTRPEFSSDRRQSTREHFVEQWRHEADLDRDPSLTLLLFGSGGDYDLHALRTREKFLESLTAAVALESQELSELATALYE
jgi:hypothetical protein